MRNDCPAAGFNPCLQKSNIAIDDNTTPSIFGSDGLRSPSQSQFSFLTRVTAFPLIACHFKKDIWLNAVKIPGKMRR
jgi:hypothetical protein